MPIWLLNIKSLWILNLTHRYWSAVELVCISCKVSERFNGSLEVHEQCRQERLPAVQRLDSLRRERGKCFRKICHKKTLWCSHNSITFQPLNPQVADICSYTFKEHFFVFDEQSMQIQEVTKNRRRKKNKNNNNKKHQKINSISKTEKKKKTEKIPNVATVQCYWLLDRRCLSPPGRPVWTADGLALKRPSFAKRSPEKRRAGPPAQLCQHRPVKHTNTQDKHELHCW